MLSKEAEVDVEVYGTSGRLIRRLPPQRQDAGFGRIAWDGRDEAGQQLAAGTYLFVLSARARGERSRHRGALVVRP